MRQTCSHKSTRAGQIGEAVVSKAAGSRHSAGLCPQILQQSGDSPHESLPHHGYCVISGMQDGRMPFAYQNGCERSSCNLARFVLLSSRQLVLAEKYQADFIFSDVSKLGECEFYLISEMNSQLIIHHPYRTLLDLQSTLSMAQDDTSLALSIINDHYMTDLTLLYPPHVIAVTAIFLALTLKPTQAGLQAAASTAAALSSATSMPKDQPGSVSGAPNTQQKKVQNLVSWLAEGEIDINAVVECSQEIISLYDVLEQYTEKTCKEQIARFVKARGLDK